MKDNNKAAEMSLVYVVIPVGEAIQKFTAAPDIRHVLQSLPSVI